jgi:DNA (cytosine-5)-methyltransferase 1
MRHGSLFSGIGGFDLASEWMGWENVFHCEWNEFGKKVLHHYWPNAESFDDITKTDFTKYANKIDILTGGFPCQPYSSAGQRKGKEDERHLWPQMLRAIQEIKPKYIVGENVFGLLNWNGGMVFDEVHSDLESAGYEVQAVVIPAAAVNAPHGRDRVWFVATNTNSGAKGSPRKSGGVESNGGDGYLFKEQRGKSSEFDNRLHQFPRNATNSQFKSEGSDGGTNNETERNIRRGNEGNVFGTLRGDGIIADTKGCGCGGGMCERCADGKRELFQNKQGWSEMGSKIEGHSGIGITSDTMQLRLQQCEDGGKMGGGQEEIRRQGSEFANGFETNGKVFNVADTTSPGGGQNNGVGKSRFNDQTSSTNSWDNFPTQSPLCGGDDGLPTELDGITFSKWRNESIKAYGNAIVPQVAYEIFKAIKMTNGN